MIIPACSFLSSAVDTRKHFRPHFFRCRTMGIFCSPLMQNLPEHQTQFSLFYFLLPHSHAWYCPSLISVRIPDIFQYRLQLRVCMSDRHSTLSLSYPLSLLPLMGTVWSVLLLNRSCIFCLLYSNFLFKACDVCCYRHSYSPSLQMPTTYFITTIFKFH